MSHFPQSAALLRRVAQRLRMTSVGSCLYKTFLILCGLYAVLLVTSRVTGVLPDVFVPQTLAILPVAAAIISILVCRRPTPVDAARVVDQQQGTKDLFLTLALLDKSAGQYKPLVARDAEAKAATIPAVAVVPFRWGRQVANAHGAVTLLLIGGLLLPQFDPFGNVATAEQVEQEQEELAKSKKATEARTAQLKREDRTGEESEAVKKAVEGLKTALNKAVPTEKKQNFDRLSQSQKQLGQLWRKISAERLKNLLNQKPSSQRFGDAKQTTKFQQWTRELQEGSAEGLKKELDDLKSQLQKLAKEKDPVKRAEMARKLQKKLKDLEDFASNNLNSKPLAAALKRAMKQMKMAQNESLSPEALESASKSMELSKLELEELAQSAKDLKRLEEALKVLQMAKQANGQEKLDGGATQDFESLTDYEEFYAQMMGMGDGEGLGGPGIGRGGEAPEDDSVKTDFQAERSKSAVQAGKVLLSLKTKGLSDEGEVKKDYRQLVGEIKQGISEAILQEQIPPGYHEGIKSYFDSIDATAQPPIKN